MRFASLRFNRVKESWHASRAAKAEQHQSEMKREYEMRHQEDNDGNGATAQVRKDQLSTVNKLDRWIVHGRSLSDASREQHDGEQANAVDRSPEM